METTAIAVVVLGVVAVVSLVAVCFCAFTLRSAARERRNHWDRSALVERAAETADHPAALIPVIEAIERMDAPPRRTTRTQRIVESNEKKAMVDAHLDPNDDDDVSVYRAMLSIGMDPASPEDVMAWNEIEPV